MGLRHTSPPQRPSEDRTVPDPIITVRGLTKRFFLRPEHRPGSWLDGLLHTLASRVQGAGAWVTAVDGVDLDVRRGEILGLLGPNGAGKTTLIKMLCGLLAPSAGTGCVLGFDLLREHSRVRANVSLVAPTADVGTDNNLSVRQNLEFWAFVYAIPAHERRRHIDEMLEVVDLGAVQDAWPMHISAGMRQRLAIARALLAGNPLIFLDEPTVKLDPAGARRIRAFVADLRVRYGVTVVVTTHYMGEAEELCDRIAIMEQGRIRALDTPAALKRRVAGEQTTEVIARGLDPGLTDAVRALPAVTAASVSVEEAETGEGVVRVRSADVEATTAALLALLAARDSARGTGRWPQRRGVERRVERKAESRSSVKPGSARPGMLCRRVTRPSLAAEFPHRIGTSQHNGRDEMAWAQCLSVRGLIRHWSVGVASTYLHTVIVSLVWYRDSSARIAVPNRWHGWLHDQETSRKHVQEACRAWHPHSASTKGVEDHGQVQRLL